MLNRLMVGILIGLGGLSCLQSVPAGAQDQSAADLSKQLANLISVPFQFNYDEGLGFEGDAGRYQLNIQPVIPTPISQDWNVITRVILPVIYLESLFPGIPGIFPPDDDDFGLGDTLTSFFLSPKEPVNGIIFGVGPAISVPTATNSELGSGKWSAGPTAVVLTQQDGLTFGILSNHVWSFAGNEDRSAVSTRRSLPVCVPIPNAPRSARTGGCAPGLPSCSRPNRRTSRAGASARRLEHFQQKWEPVLRPEPKAGAKRRKCDKSIS